MPFGIESGLAVIQLMQSWGAWLEPPMQFFSLLGIEPFYLLVMPALLWCYDRDLGVRLGLILLFSAALNSTLKLAFGSPRPYWVSDRIQALSSEPSFGLPSGHAQNAVAVWGLLAAGLQNAWVHVSAAALIVMISASRVYLGVHFPQDVVAGAVIGVAVLSAFIVLERPVAKRLTELRLTAQLGVAFVASAGLLLSGLIAWDRAQSFVLPLRWHAAALEATGEAIDPLQIEDLFTAAGTLFGLSAGAGLLYDWDGFRAEGSLAQRLYRYTLGLSVLVVLYWGLGAVELDPYSAAAYAWRYVRFALIGLWVTYGGPRLFARLGWARS